MYSESGYWTVCKIPEMLAFFGSLPDDRRHFLALSGDLLGSDRLSFLLLLQTPRNVPLGLQWCFCVLFLRSRKSIRVYVQHVRTTWWSNSSTTAYLSIHFVNWSGSPRDEKFAFLVHLHNVTQPLWALSSPCPRLQTFPISLEKHLKKAEKKIFWGRTYGDFS